ncbi:MAG TPA: hypothetical protein VMU02_08500 [bacterium]|nr:hypothetical protein [bacterium]
MLGFMGFVWMLIVGIIMIIPFWKIFQKAGLTPALSILMIIPLINLVMIYYLAFTDWPALRGKQPPQP